jgi:hypothetical protein
MEGKRAAKSIKINGAGAPMDFAACPGSINRPVFETKADFLPLKVPQ